MLNYDEYRFLCDLIDGNCGEDMTSLSNIKIINQLMSRGLIEIGFRPSSEGHEQIAMFEESNSNATNDNLSSNATNDNSSSNADKDNYRECLIRALTSLGPYFGKKTASKIVDKFSTLERILEISNDDIYALLGDTRKARGLIEFKKDEWSIEQVKYKLLKSEQKRKIELLREKKWDDAIKRYDARKKAEEAVLNA